MTGILAGGALCTPSQAQETPGYPSKVVRIIVGYQAGGPTDVTARLVAAKMQELLGQAVIVENKPGGGSHIASEYAAGAIPDGHTLLLASSTITLSVGAQPKMRWNVNDSFEPISLIMSAPTVLAIANGVQAKSLGELVALAKASPGTLTFASSGPSSTPHVAGELLKHRAGIDINHVPYRGASSAAQDLIAGHVTMSFITSVTGIPLVKEGAVRPIAVAAASRLSQLPEVPTMSEAGIPGFIADSWNGLFAPRGTPKPIIARLHKAIVQALASPDVRTVLEKQGAVVVGNTPEEFKAHIEDEIRRWDDLAREAKIRFN